MVLGVFRSPDRRCRIEVVRERGRELYRSWVRGFRCRDCVDIAALESILREGGIDLAELIED
jgi:hypothetical protein